MTREFLTRADEYIDARCRDSLIGRNRVRQVCRKCGRAGALLPSVEHDYRAFELSARGVKHYGQVPQRRDLIAGLKPVGPSMRLPLTAVPSCCRYRQLPAFAGLFEHEVMAG